MASPQADAIHAHMRANRASAPPRPTWHENRAALEAMASSLTETPKGVNFGDVAGDVEPGGRWVSPAGRGEQHRDEQHRPVVGSARPLLLYFHGGGYVVGSARTHERMVGHIVRATGVSAWLVEYRLAPEHPHPCALDDATSAYEFLLARGYDPNDIIVGGDSAGGGLALAMLLAIGGQDRRRPRAAFVMSPWADLACTAPSMESRSADDLIADRAFLASAAQAYLGSTTPLAPTASPLWGDLSVLPTMLVQVGDHEVLLDDSTRLVERARAAGVDATLQVFAEMQHVFQMNVGRMPEADEAITAICRFIDDQLDRRTAR